MLPTASDRAFEKDLFFRDPQGKPVLPLETKPLYTFGCLIRKTEERLLQLFSQGQLSGTTHTCLGEELCHISVVRALNDPQDVVLSNHRNHGHFLTYSGDFLGLVAEIMGREAGVCGGIGGSQHLASRHFHSNGVQGGMTAIGVGHALAMRMRRESGVVATIIGDGTLGQGLLYEALNLASIWELPQLFVVENNGIAQTTTTSLTTGGTLAGRAAAFGIQCWQLDDSAGDFLEQAENVVAAVRTSRKPGFLVIDTRRLGPHSKGDDLRDAAVLDAIRARDPLEALGTRLTATDREEIQARTSEFVDRICKLAMDSPNAQHLQARHSIFVNSPTVYPDRPPTEDDRRNVRGDLNAALRSALESSPDVILLGEDMHDPYGGAFKVTAGLSTKFPDRTISTPISEAGVVGAGIGLALAGFRPVVEIMFADFVTLAFDQICNHAVKFPGMFADAQVPLVIRTPAGGRRGYGPTHSQNPEAMLCSVAGLTVVFPSQRHAVGDLLWNTIFRWPYPTVFLEHKLLYGQPVDAAGYRLVPADSGDAGAELFPTMVRGSADPDVTLVAYGGMVEIAEEAARKLEAEQLEVEMVIPSLLAPLPKRTMTALLMSRPRIVMVEEAPGTSGYGAELAAALLEAGFRGRYARVGTPPVPIPAARSLESLIMPDAHRICQAVLELLVT